MEETKRILTGSHDVSHAAEQDEDLKALKMGGCQDGKLCSSKSCLVAFEGREAKSNRGERNRIEEILRKLYAKKPSKKKKKKLHLAINKSIHKELERSNLNAESRLSVSNDSVKPTTLGSQNNRLIKTRSYLPSHSYNVYSYYYPKYDMSYGHCLYVTPWTLEVPTDNTLQIAQLAGAAKEMRLLSLERNWKRIGWKRRVNSARRSFTFPANVEWESTIYYFPRWDLSFYPLPISRIRPPFCVDTAFPVETVLEEEEADSTPLEDLCYWKDLVEFEVKNTENASCVTSTRTDLSSKSASSNQLTSTDDLRRTQKTQSFRNFGERVIITFPAVAKDTRLKSSSSQIHEEMNHLQINQSQLNDDSETEQDYRSSSCTKRKPSKLFKQFKNKLSPLEEVPKSASYKIDSKLVENELRDVPVFREDERKRANENKSEGVLNQRQSRAVGQADHKVKVRLSQGRRYEGKSNQSFRNIDEPRSRVPLYLADVVLMEGGMKPGDGADLRISEDNLTMAKDDITSTNNMNCEFSSVNEMDDTIPDGGLRGDFISGRSNKNTQKCIKGHTRSVSASHVRETNDIRTTLENQAHTRKPRQCVLTVDPLQVDCNIQRSSLSVTHDFVCKSEMILHSSVIFDVETDRNIIGNRSVNEGMSEDCHQPPFVPEIYQSRVYSEHALYKEESVSVVESKKTFCKRMKVERKTAMQKLVFVRSSSAGVSNGTRAGDILRQDHKLSQDSTVDFPQQRNSDRKTVQTTTRHTEKHAKDWCKSCRIVEFTQSDSPPIGKGIQDATKSRLRLLQDLRPVDIREEPKTYLSIWQNRRAIHAEFLKRNPLLLFPSQLKIAQTDHPLD